MRSRKRAVEKELRGANNLRVVSLFFLFRKGIALQNRGFFGRRVLCADPIALTAENVGKIMQELLPVHKDNAKEIRQLKEFYKGNQPIIDRRKEVRPEITNIVVENRAFEIVEFKKGYEFSHPVQYTNAGKNMETEVDTLNMFARVDGKEAKDLSLAEDFYISGNAYKITLPKQNVTEDDAPYFTDVLPPETTFVVYSNAVGRPALFAGTYVIKSDGLGKELHHCGIYTDAKYFEWKSTGKIDFSKTPVEKPNGMKAIPIVEYILNESRMGYVEICYHLFNAINTVNSNRLDGIEQFVQALLVFINCQLQEDENGNKRVPRTGDAIEVGNGQGNADVKFLTSQLDQSQVQVTKDDLLRSAYEIAGVPDRQNRNQGGGDTGQAVVLRNGWGAAEARAMSTEKPFRRSEMEYLKLVLSICRTAGEIKVLNLKEIDIKFTRNRSDNMLVKAQALQIMQKCGVPKDVAYEVCELFSDPAAVWEKAEKYSNLVDAPSEGEKLGDQVEI